MKGLLQLPLLHFLAVFLMPASGGHSGGHSNTILPMHFAGFGGIPMGGMPVGPPPFALLANQLAAMRATNLRAGQLVNLLEKSNQKSILTSAVRTLAANLIQKMTRKRVAVSAPQRGKTTTVVTQEHRPMLHLDAHSRVIPHLHLNEAAHVHVNANPHVHLLDFAATPDLTSSNFFGDSSLNNIIFQQPQNRYHYDILQPQTIFQQPLLQPVMQPIFQPILQPRVIHQPHYIDRPVVKEVIKEVIRPVIKEVVRQPTIIKQIIQRPAPVQQITKQVFLPQPQITRQVPIQQHITRQVPIQQHITRQVPVQQVQQVQQRVFPHQQKRIWSVKGGRR